MKKFLILSLTLGLLSVSAMAQMPSVTIEDHKGDAFNTSSLLEEKTPMIISFWSVPSPKWIHLTEVSTWISARASMIKPTLFNGMVLEQLTRIRASSLPVREIAGSIRSTPRLDTKVFPLSVRGCTRK